MTVSEIKYPEPPAFTVAAVIAPPTTVVSTVKEEPVPPLVATLVPAVNPPPPPTLTPVVTTAPGVGSPLSASVSVVEVARLLSIALNCSNALSSFACTLASV